MNKRKVSLITGFIFMVFVVAMLAVPVFAKDSGRCVRCGMIIANAPNWESRMHKEGEDKKLFCSPKCMLLTNPSDSDTSHIKLRAMDYYSTKLIDAKTAWYVCGSEIMGPMGPDLIPFADKVSAEEFMKEHNGTGLFTYSELTAAKLKELVPMNKKHKHHKKIHEKKTDS